VFTRDGKLLMRGDRVLVSAAPLLGDIGPRLGVVISFSEVREERLAVIVLDGPTSAGTSVVEVQPHDVAWFPPDLEQASRQED
jgi:hypothetical protein